MLSFWWPVSWLLGAVDYSFLLLKIFLSRPKFFSKGWGDLESVYAEQDKLLSGNNKDVLKLTEDQIQWEETMEESSIIVRRGRFLSPLAHLLPKESHCCRFHVVSPRDTKSSSDFHVIMLPATGEMGKSTRLNMARQLAIQHGYSSVIITAPFYGARKPKTQRLFCISTVSDLVLQAQSIIQEAAMLTIYCLNRTPSSKVCITGFSWGAAMSSCAASAALLGVSDAEGKRIACALYVGSASPVVLADGVMESSIDWKALFTGKEGSSAEQALYNELNKTQLSILTAPLRSTKSLGAVHVACTSHDHFIRRRYADEFLQQLGALAPKIEVSWLPGGHIFAMMLRPFLQKRLVEQTVKALEKTE
jgi:hypothetical protein